MKRLVRSFTGDERAVTLVEYAFIVALVSVAAITILTSLGTTLTSFYTTISTTLATA